MNMMILSQIGGIILLSFICYLFWTKIGQFPQPLTSSPKKNHEIIQIIFVFILGFILNTVYWLMDLPAIIFYPSYRLNISFFVICGVILFIELGFNHRNLTEMSIIGGNYSSSGLKVAFSGIFVGLLWGYIQFLSGYRSNPITLVGGIIWFLSPAFVEELEFRSFYQSKLERLFTQKQSLCIQSILFGLIHIPTDFFGAIWWNGGQDIIFSLLTLVFQSLMGLFFGLLFIKTRSIWPSVIAHFLFDFMIAIIMLGYQ